MSTCLLLGGTGLVGGHLLHVLLEDPSYHAVTALTRRSLGVQKTAKLTEVICDLGDPRTYAAHVAVDDVFCCLGTTIKKAGSQAAFRQVDCEYPLAVARAAAAAGAGQFLIVTAVGASPKSSIFYNRVKGELEEQLKGLSFPKGVKIFHPSMLLGERGESRPAERVGVVLMRATAPLFVGGLKRYRAIEGAQVARAMWQAARSEPAGTRVYEGESLFELAGRS